MRIEGSHTTTATGDNTFFKECITLLFSICELNRPEEGPKSDYHPPAGHLGRATSHTRAPLSRRRVMSVSIACDPSRTDATGCADESAPLLTPRSAHRSAKTDGKYATFRALGALGALACCGLIAVSLGASHAYVLAYACLPRSRHTPSSFPRNLSSHRTPPQGLTVPVRVIRLYRSRLTPPRRHRRRERPLLGSPRKLQGRI